MASTVTEQELIKKIPTIIRKKEQKRLLGTGLPTIRESPLPSTVDHINPESVLRKKSRILTHPPSYSKQDERPEVIGQKQAQDAIRAIRSGVPIVIPKINPTWVKLQKHAPEVNIEKKYRNEGVTSVRQTAPGRTRRGRGRKRKRRKTRKRRRKPKTRRRKKDRRRRRRRRRTHKK